MEFVYVYNLFIVKVEDFVDVLEFLSFLFWLEIYLIKILNNVLKEFGVGKCGV